MGAGNFYHEEKNMKELDRGKKSLRAVSPLKMIGASRKKIKWHRCSTSSRSHLEKVIFFPPSPLFFHARKKHRE